jgi:hypothetical protein
LRWKVSSQTDANGKRGAKPAMAATVPSAFASTPAPPPLSSSPPAPAPRPGMKMRYGLIVIGLLVAGAIALNAQDNSAQRSSSVLTPKTQLEADEFDEWNTTKILILHAFVGLKEVK